jgi:anti-sigma factor RsiW
MDKMPRLTAEERDNLVAYLDSELDDAAAREIEQKLAQSPIARHDVELLSRTWDLLDILPRHSVTAEFTQKTLAIAKSQEAPAYDQLAWWSRITRRGTILAAWAAALAAAGVIGFRATHDWVPNEAQMLLDDLPVIQNLDLYLETNVDSIDFLQELRKHKIFQDEPQSPDQ